MVRILYKINKNPNIKAFMLSLGVFLCLLRALAMYLTVYLREVGYNGHW
jgi:hypothetical protein